MTGHRIHIAHSIGSVRQPRLNDCWAAALAMVVGQRGGRHLWVDNVRRIATDAHIQLNRDGSLPRGNAANVRRLAGALHLRFHDVMSQSFTISLMETLLRPGPLAVFGDFDYDGQQRFHVIAVYRLFGDGTSAGTTISYIDPYAGRYVNKTWLQFYNAADGGSFLADPHFVVGH